MSLLSLSKHNESLKRKRDDFTWNIEQLVVWLKEMCNDGTLSYRLPLFVSILKKQHKTKKHAPVQCKTWIGYDEYEHYVLSDHLNHVVYDFEGALNDLERICSDMKVIDDKEFVYIQVERLIDEILDKTYCWE